MVVNRNLKLLFCAAGIFICYFYYGMLQEKITRGQYGNNERFRYMCSLVFVQCLVNYIFAKLLLLTVMNQGEDTTTVWYYGSAALTYLLAMVSSNMALEFINYPTQVIGKAGKPIPVMIFGVLLGKKVYPFKKYLFVFLIVIGVVMFMYKDSVTSTRGHNTMYFGELLVLLSLTMDGLLSAVQERMKLEHQTKSGHMMLNMNFWSIIYSGTMILISNEHYQFIQFLNRNPETLWHIGTLSLAGAFGQYFIFLTVADFGPLPCSIITTTRKFFTVIGSVLFFGNSLSNRQWFSAFIVFLGLFLDAMYSKKVVPNQSKRENKSYKHSVRDTLFNVLSLKM